MNSQPMGLYPMETLKQGARRFGVPFLNPCVNSSRERCIPEDGAVFPEPHVDVRVVCPLVEGRLFLPFRCFPDGYGRRRRDCDNPEGYDRPVLPALAPTSPGSRSATAWVHPMKHC